MIFYMQKLPWKFYYPELLLISTTKTWMGNKRVVVTCWKYFTSCSCNSPDFTCGYRIINKHSEYKWPHWLLTRGLTPSAAFTTDLGSDAVSSWSTWSWRCSRYRRSSSLGSPASVLWPPLFPAPSWSALWYPFGAPAPPGRTPPPLWWMLHQSVHPAPAWKTLLSSVSSLWEKTVKQ